MGNTYPNDIVSVIIPVFNSARFLRKTIDSVLEQTYSPLEIVIIDDSSNDDSPKIIEEYQTRNANIISHRLEQNSGAAVARNKGLEIAGGRFIAFLDSDDIWLPEKTEKQLRFMRENRSAISYSSFQMIDENGRIIKNNVRVPEKTNYQILLKNTVIATSTVIVDRSITGPFKMPLLRSGQDYATWLMLMRRGICADGINKVLTSYRKVNNSLSSNKLKSVGQVWYIQTKIEKISPLHAVWNCSVYACNAFRKHYL